MKSTSRAGSWITGLFGLLFLAAGCVLLALPARAVRHARAMQAWPAVPAWVLEARLEERRSDESTTYRAVASYRYTAGGRERVGTRVGVHGGADNLGTWHQDRYRELADARRRNVPVMARVNPRDPADAVLYPDVRSGMVLMMGGIGTLFSLVGVGLVVAAGSMGHRAGRARRLAEEYPGEPWRWREDWVSGVLPADNHRRARSALSFAVVWNLITGFAFAAALSNRGLPLMPKLIIGLFVLIGAGLFGWAIRERRVAQLYGAATLRLAEVPGVLGGRLAGAVELAGPVRTEEGFRVKVSCIERVRRGKNTRDETRWSDERLLDQEALPAHEGGLAVPVLFALPFDQPASSEPGALARVRWEVSVTARQPGVDVDVRFDVPVFRTPESRPDFQLDEEPLARYLAREG